MILSDKEIQERIESPLNLLNRLRESVKPRIPSLPAPDSKEIIEDLEEKIAIGTVRSKAAAILTSCLTELNTRIRDVQKPEKLAQIAAEMNKVLQTRSEKEDQKQAQIIVYSPQVVNESQFNTIVVKD